MFRTRWIGILGLVSTLGLAAPAFAQEAVPCQNQAAGYGYDYSQQQLLDQGRAAEQAAAAQAAAQEAAAQQAAWSAERAHTIRYWRNQQELHRRRWLVQYY